MIAVREATSMDRDAVAELCDLAFKPLRQIYRPKRLPASAKPDTTIKPIRLVAEIGGSVAGTVQYRDHLDRFHLLGLAVHPSYQRKGVARSLVASLETLARGRGVRSLSLCTVKETGSIEVFERLGFRTVREQPDDLSESDLYEQLTDVYMEKVIG